MPHRLEITLKPELFDAEGEGIRHKAEDYFDIRIDRIRTVQILTIDADLTSGQLETIRTEVFTNPVTQVSAYTPLNLPFDWAIWVGYRPGVRDNPGSTAVEAIEDILGLKIGAEEAVYTSKLFCLEGDGITAQQIDMIAGELLANDIIQQWKIFSRENWDPEQGTGLIIPRVILDHVPTVTTVPIDSNETLQALSDERNLALNPADIPVIREYFLDPEVKAGREAVGLSDPTDIELEYISPGPQRPLQPQYLPGPFSVPGYGYRGIRNH